MTALVILNTDGSTGEYERFPSVGQLQGAHALLGPNLTLHAPRIDRTLTLWTGNEHPSKQPLNRLAWLVYGTGRIHGDAVIGREDGTLMTGGQVETIMALARTLERYGWERAVALGRRYIEQDARRG